MVQAKGLYRGIAMTIAGSDSGGGAGIQADLKTFAALRVFGTTAITALTVQNSQGVAGFATVADEVVAGQIRVVADDMDVRAFKTGMLADARTIRVVASSLAPYMKKEGASLVVDPVMVAQSGDRLVSEDTQAALIDLLLPLATLITPNLPEAECLLGAKPGSLQDRGAMRDAARALRERMGCAVLLKGGHLRGGDSIVDVLALGEKLLSFEDERIETTCNHGTGCTLSAAITAELAAGCSLETAVERGRAYLREALLHGVAFGKGAGCTGHAVVLPWVSEGKGQ